MGEATKDGDDAEEETREGVSNSGRELTNIEKEVTEYLARLVAHIMAGTPMVPPGRRRDGGEQVWSVEGGPGYKTSV